MPSEPIRDLEHRFNLDGRVYVAQVCSGATHTAAPVFMRDFDIAVVTCASDELFDFDNDDPHFLAQRVVADISTRLPNVSEAELAAFYDEVVVWICEHRRAAAETAHEDD
jgi:hypothetical protein